MRAEDALLAGSRSRRAVVEVAGEAHAEQRVGAQALRRGRGRGRWRRRSPRSCCMPSAASSARQHRGSGGARRTAPPAWRAPRRASTRGSKAPSVRDAQPSSSSRPTIAIQPVTMSSASSPARRARRARGCRGRSGEDQQREDQAGAVEAPPKKRDRGGQRARSRPAGSSAACSSAPGPGWLCSRRDCVCEDFAGGLQGPDRLGQRGFNHDVARAPSLVASAD